MNSVCVNTQNSNINFGCIWSKKTRVMLPSIADRVINPRHLSKLDRSLARSNGAETARTLLSETNNPKAVRDVIQTAAFYEDYDFLKGFNKTLQKSDKSLLKQAYSILNF